MTNNHGSLSGDEFLLGYISEYLDGEVPKELLQSYSELVKKHEADIELFQDVRGRYQMAVAKLIAPEPLKHKLRTLVQDDKIRETIEASEIQDVEQNFRLQGVLRRVVFVTVLFSVIGYVAYWLMPKSAEKINIVEYVGYEAVAMTEDPEGRLNLPTTSLEEIRQFTMQLPGLEFAPQVLRELGGWEPEGVSLIDYEVMKVVAIMYKNPSRGGERLHHFMIQGSMQAIPFTGEEADYRGLRYRVYASDRLNMLVWQQTPDMVGVLAGHRSAPELAELARAGTPE